VFLYAFDLLEWNGEDYRQHPLEKRKEKIRKNPGADSGDASLQNGIGGYRVKATGFSVSKRSHKKMGENKESWFASGAAGSGWELVKELQNLS
jgi:hypothetical protein